MELGLKDYQARVSYSCERFATTEAMYNRISRILFHSGYWRCDAVINLEVDASAELCAECAESI